MLKRLTISKNKIREIYYKPGFQDLYMVTMEDNLINSWKTFDELNKFKNITHLRCSGNPILESQGSLPQQIGLARNIVISRLQFLRNINGSEIDPGERKDAELHYMKRTYEEYI